MTFRTALFWLHLAAGLIAGVAIGIMCFTGTVLAFEHELVAWAERDARRIAAPAEGTPRLPLDELQRKVRQAQPEFRPAGVTLESDPAAAVGFSAGREGGFYANPYTGEVRSPASGRVAGFMRLMTDWHRFLGRAGDSRPVGKAINGACNLAFCVLALSGLYLWMPRTWSWRGVRAIALFNFKSSGKARDFNWHNVIGLWSAPVLIVLTLTAVPISFRWGGNLIYQMSGEEPPAQAGPGAALPAVAIKRPSPEALPLGYDTLVARVQQDFPRWEQINVRTGNNPRGPRPEVNTATPTREVSAAATQEPRRARGASEVRSVPQPVTVTIREAGSWPRTATTTLTLNPYTGAELKRESFADLSPARQIRSWTRFLHTGQALGRVGQLVAGLACLGGCFLVYTGFALAWRRFFGRQPDMARNQAG